VGVVAGLREAAADMPGAARRLAGSAVNWSSRWEESFDDSLLDQIIARLGAEH
jgi:hypothetical protein